MAQRTPLRIYCWHPISDIIRVVSLRKGPWHYQRRIAEACRSLVEDYSSTCKLHRLEIVYGALRPLMSTAAREWLAASRLRVARERTKPTRPRRFRDRAAHS